jgi:hypothetical protein
MPQWKFDTWAELLSSFKLLVLDDDRRSEERRSSSDLSTQTTSPKSISNSENQDDGAMAADPKRVLCEP